MATSKKPNYSQTGGAYAPIGYGGGITGHGRPGGKGGTGGITGEGRPGGKKPLKVKRGAGYVTGPPTYRTGPQSDPVHIAPVAVHIAPVTSGIHFMDLQGGGIPLPKNFRPFRQPISPFPYSGGSTPYKRPTRARLGGSKQMGPTSRDRRIYT